MIQGCQKIQTERLSIPYSMFDRKTSVDRLLFLRILFTRHFALMTTRKNGFG